MADFTQIIQEINDDIKTNGVGAITGAKLNQVLRDMIDAVNAAKTDILPDGALYGGFAYPNEQTPYYGDDHRYFYLAIQQGNYPAFGVDLDGNRLVLFYWIEQGQEWYSSFLAVTPTGLQNALQGYLESRYLYLSLGFDAFSPNSSYVVGDYVVNVDNEGILYVFTSNHPAGQWDEDDVAEASLVDYITDYVGKQLSGKQDVISDLSTIRSGAAAGATAYQKPSGGIPKTDLASGVQTSLGKADTAFQKPSGGIPASDLASAVQTSLGKADTALQSYNETDPVFSASYAAGITSGDIADWDGKAEPIEIVDASTPPMTMQPDKVYQYGTLSGDTTFPLLLFINDGKAHIHCWTFATPATAPTITWPSAITSWAGGSAPTINASKNYEVSVMDGIATIIEA